MSGFNQLKSDEIEKKLTPPSVCGDSDLGPVFTWAHNTEHKT